MTRGLDRKLEERFFERQRQEILGRVGAYERRRRVRRTALPVAAVLLVGALLAGVFLVRAPSPQGAETDWLFAWSLPAESGTVDPLVAYGPDDASGATDLATTAVGSEAPGIETDLLPPLPSQIEDSADADVGSTTNSGRG
jgi:hypothetical protein